MKNVHILNGDSLAESFPENFLENLIIWRECLVDGPVSQKDFFQKREKFISEKYEISDADYSRKVMIEFDKLQSIPENSNVYFWFGDDLFCQINFWFLISALKKKKLHLFRVFPNETDYDFVDFESNAIQKYIEHSKNISEAEKLNISMLWKQYQNDQSFESFDSEVIRKFQELKMANNNRFNGNLNEELIKIKNQFNIFEEFFAIFQKKFPIYGFGDLQLLQLWKNL